VGATRASTVTAWQQPLDHVGVWDALDAGGQQQRFSTRRVIGQA